MFFILMGLILAIIACGVVSCYKWWKEISLPNFVYFIITGILLFLMFFTVFNAGKIPNQLLKDIMLFESAVTFVVLIYSSILLFIKQLIVWIGKLFHCDKKFFRVIGNKKIIVPVILSVTAVVGVAGYINMGIIRTTDFTVDIEKASENQSLNVAVISDMHIGVANHKSTIDTIVSEVNEMNTDAVFLVGDIFDESTTVSEMEYFSNAFSDVHSTYGTYYVLGNHEGYSGGDTTQYFRDAGITVLQDTTAVIGGDVTVIGLRDQYDTAKKDIAQIIKDENVDLSKPVIMLKHEPLNLMSYADAGVDLSFSGHTHGEQFPFTKELFSLANDMMYGQEMFGNMTAITTSGAGGWGFHFKLPAKSEIARVDINFE